jgi:hypothetical protein
MNTTQPAKAQAMSIETITCFLIENKLGDIVAFCDTLEFARAEVERLTAATGETYTIIKHRDTNGLTTHERV